MVIRAAALASLCVSSPSFAQRESSVRLEYLRGPGAETCPDQPAVHSAVGDLLGYDPFHDEGRRTIRARVARNARGLEAAVDLQEAAGPWRGVRRLESSKADCAQLASALVLSLAIAIDPMLAARPPQRDADPPPLAQPTFTVLAAPPEPADRPPPPPSGPTTRLVALSAHGALGSAPGPAPGFELLAGLRRGRLSANIVGRLDLPAFKEAGGGRISGWLALGSVLTCVHHRALAGCALIGGGVRRLEGHELDHAQQTTQPMAVAGARAALLIPLRDSVSAYLHADLLGEFIETAVLVGGRQAWATPPVSAAAGAGIAAFFP